VPVVPSHSYPGVYIQEVPSGVRTITGVSTSITAFLGRAARGPVNDPTTINSYADFERSFGGIWSSSALGYAVRDYYMNGGSQAIIVRLYSAPAAPALASTPKSTPSASVPPKINAPLSVNGLPLETKYPGSWGNYLRARVEASSAKDAENRFGVNKDALFDLTVFDTQTNTLEVFRNLSLQPGPQLISSVLLNSSSLVRIPETATLPTAVPTPHAAIPAKGKTIWQDDTTSTGVADADRVTDGGDLTVDSFTGDGFQANKQGLYALEHVDLFNLLVIPPYNNGDVDAGLIGEAAIYCENRRAFLLVDPPSSWTNKKAAIDGINSDAGVGTFSKNAALFFPRFKRANLFDDFVPSGAVAGIIARTDTQRGVWKAPAGLDATITGVSQLSVRLTNDENGELNPLGVNCLRTMSAVGSVVWGARTLQGDDRLGSEWKYIPVRRLALYIEESLYRGTQWAVFEPNDEPLWAQLRLNIGTFMHDLFRQGAFQGQKSTDAYFVQCDSTTTTQSDIDQGIVNVSVGFAPLKPAEFVILYLQQIAGQLAV